jgi:hypothetical protein
MLAHEVPQLSPKSHFDLWNELGFEFSRWLCSTRLSRQNRSDRFPNRSDRFSHVGCRGEFLREKSLSCYGCYCSKEERFLRQFFSH